MFLSTSLKNFVVRTQKWQIKCRTLKSINLKVRDIERDIKREVERYIEREITREIERNMEKKRKGKERERKREWGKQGKNERYKQKRE